MFGKLLSRLGVASSTQSIARAAHGPYRNAAVDRIYTMLFCDAPGAFAPADGATPAAWQSMLFTDSPDAAAVRALADDAHAESRVRALAFGRLRAMGEAVAPKTLLGVVVEVPLEGGLDTLAAYVDGSVRYINRTGRLSIFEGGVEAIAPAARALLEASRAVVARIGPWDKPRLPPPTAGNIRLSFIVSDGLYFGEGPMSVMEREPLAGPVIERAGALLQRVVAMAIQ